MFFRACDVLAWQFLMRWPSSHITTSGPGRAKALSIPGGREPATHIFSDTLSTLLLRKKYHTLHMWPTRDRPCFLCFLPLLSTFLTFEQFLLPVLFIQVDDNSHKALLQRQETHSNITPTAAYGYDGEDGVSLCVSKQDVDEGDDLQRLAQAHAVSEDAAEAAAAAEPLRRLHQVVVQETNSTDLRTRRHGGRWREASEKK
ncbi:hypothetical protein EYF80_046402 [Liparis tanakae]|uniref:Uncharacterized protein n=1 Tax=Liparis tanakae TaxID=230148 RepID=A0A4Z2FRL2_9TELE|nr:hypothetical protein EYF80_046402 [Liparis tanakae]